jgi:hypothetical protein
MGTKSKSFALVIVVLFLIPVVTLQQTAVAQPSNQAPNIEFQKEYGDNQSMGVSNIFQTIDGGYIFVDWGRSHYADVSSAICYKIDSSGNMQWNKTLPKFIASYVIQTSDEGYELSGEFPSTPSIIKMDSQGNIQWIANYSSLQSFSIQGSSTDGSIKTSDGGYAKWTLGRIIKTDSHNNNQWIENFTYPSDNYNGISPLSFFSLIETSDGSLAALGVGYYRAYKGPIFLIKTEPFLPAPSPSNLQNPLPAPYSLEMTFLVVSILSIIAISLLLFRRHRKTISQNKTNV